MAVKISQLTAAASASGTQEFEVNDSGASRKVTGSQIKTFVKDAFAPSDIVGVTASVAEINKLTGTPAGLTATELGYVDGVTSAIQTQLNGKAPLTGTGTSGTWPISISGDAASVDGKSINTLTAAGGIAYASDTTTLAAIGAGTAGQALLSGGAGAPTWGNITPTTAQVGTATAGLAAGAVGSYMFAKASAAGDTAFGATRAGSDIFPTSAISGVSGTASNVNMASGSAQSGTWRAMGYYDYSTPNGTSGSSSGATLWLRIS